MTDRRPSMGAEDFADYPTSVPGCMRMLGVRSPRKKITPQHTSTFNLDEKALLLGVRLFTQILLAWPDTNALILQVVAGDVKFEWVWFETDRLVSKRKSSYFAAVESPP